MSETLPERQAEVPGPGSCDGDVSCCIISVAQYWTATTLQNRRVFLNFRDYDSHFISPALKDFAVHEILVIGHVREKYLTLSLDKYLVFKASLQFLRASLQTLQTNLAKGGIDQFPNLKKKFSAETDDGLRLLVRKGVYP